MKKKLIILSLFLCISLIATSQITIGIDEEPLEGALLQLKSITVTGNNPNSTKGLLLPRVELDPVASVSGTMAQKLVASLKLILPSGASVDAEQHTGLMVYNIADLTVTTGAPFAETKICPGVYVWDGTQWIRTMLKECL